MKKIIISMVVASALSTTIFAAEQSVLTRTVVKMVGQIKDIEARNKFLEERQSSILKTLESINSLLSAQQKAVIGNKANLSDKIGEEVSNLHLELNGDLVKIKDDQQTDKETLLKLQKNLEAMRKELSSLGADSDIEVPEVDAAIREYLGE